ncbi:MAG: AAA family ATPase [Desulfobacteraceae bacterium]|jgi:general secretion pathway protein A|nr:AAA family ATPase [Desulfobacteraceae bacterium]
MDYFSILNLKKEPFSNSPDPEFFFHSRQHLDCLQKLELSLLLRRGLNVIVGEVGTGKTTLCRQLIRRFAQKEEIETHLILDPHFLNATEFLATVTKMLVGKKPSAGSLDWQIKEHIKQYLFHKGVDQKKTVILIIDEGQKIPAFCLEILREFLNYETNEYKLLQIVIFAQTEFENTIRKYPNFADRINLFHLLKPLGFNDTRLMIKFRLEKSSNSRRKLNLFTYPALWAIYRITGGYPRKIINLCHQSILSMIIQNRSKSGYFLVRACARRVFAEESRRRKMILSGVALTAAAAVLLLTLLPLDGIISLPSRGVEKLKALFLNDPKLETSAVLPQTSTPTVRAQLAPSEFSKPSPPAKMAQPVKVEEEPPTPPEIVKTDQAAKVEEASVTVAETVTEDTPKDPAPAAAHSSILGQITLRRDETLSRIIQRVYGNFNSKYFKSFILANPDIEDPDRVEVGQIISLPAMPVELTPLDRPVWWVKVDQTDLLEDAYNVFRNYPENASAMRLIPYWTPGNGTQFSVVLSKLFSDEQTARDELALVPARLLSNSKVVSSWDRKSVYFADPYFGQKH